MRLSFFFLLLAGAVGCSSSGFTVGTPDVDVDGDPADTGVDATKPDATTDLGGDGTTDTGTLNACGGRSPLADTPGKDCGACGKLVCDATNEGLHCEDPGKNACGGCGKLTGAVGDACGFCGRLGCRADGTALDCLNPDKNACGGCSKLPGKPGDACGGGTCGSGTLACKDSDTFTCTGASGTNDCGGCGTLAGKPNTACGGCGKYVCATGGASVTCVEATPAPGTVCGTCGSSTYGCSATGVTTCKTPDDATSFADVDMGKSPDVIKPALDHAHELAVAYTARHTGRLQYLKLTMSRDAYACPVNAVEVFDVGVTEIGGGTSDAVYDLGAGGDGTTIVDASLPACSSPDPGCKCATAGVTCTCTGITDGQLYVYAYKGIPGGSGTFLGYSSMPVTLIGSTPSLQFLVFPSGMPIVNTGDPVYFQLFLTGATQRVLLSGVSAGPVGSDPDLTLYTRTDYPSPVTAWTKLGAVPQTLVQITGCR